MTASHSSAPTARAVSASGATLALVAAFLVAAPYVRLTPFAAPYDSQRIVELVLIGAVVLLTATASGARAVRSGGSGLSLGSRLALAGGFSLGVLSSVAAPEPLYAFVEVGLFAGLVGVAFFLAGAWGEANEDPRAGVEAVALACALSYGALVYARHLAGVLDGGEGWPHDPGAFTHPRFLGQLQLVIVPLLLSLSIRLREDGSRRLATRAGVACLRMVAAAHVAILLASGGRASWLGVGLGVLTALGLFRGRVRPFLREGAVVAVLSFLLFGLVFVLLSDLGLADQYARGGDGTSGRMEHWASALLIVRDRPWLGIGPMHYAYLETLYGAHPHNLALQLASEWGLPAAVLLGGTALRGAWAWGREVSRPGAPPSRSAWRAALTVALVATMANAMFDSFAMVPLAQVWTALVLASLLAECRRIEGPARARLVPHRMTLRGRAAVFGVVAIAWLPSVVVAARDLPVDRVYERRAWLNPINPTPRFWEVGTIAPPEGTPADLQRKYWPWNPHASHASSATDEPVSERAARGRSR